MNEELDEDHDDHHYDYHVLDPHHAEHTNKRIVTDIFWEAMALFVFAFVLFVIISFVFYIFN